MVINKSEDKDMCRFSVIIPVYNAESSVSTCLKSIRCQTFDDYELIVVDDGSMDSSLKVVEKATFGLPSKRLKIISQPNSGAGAARNAGIDAVTGEYIVFIDADDYVDNDYLQQIDDIIRKESSDVVFVDIIRENDHGRIMRYELMSRFQHLPKDRMIRWQLTGKMPWGGVRKIVRSSIVKDNHLRYATSIKVGEESIYSFNVLQLAQRISFQSRSYYHYIDNSTSLTSNDVVGNCQAVFSFMFQYLRDTGQDIMYATTINAMAVTTAAIACNVIFYEKNLWNGYREAKMLLKKYKKEMSGETDKDSLDNRVRFLMPFLKNGIIIPVWIANRLQKAYKRIKMSF